MEDDELAAFRRAPDEWHRLKEEQQGQLMRDCRWHQCGPAKTTPFKLYKKYGGFCCPHPHPQIPQIHTIAYKSYF